MLEILDAEVLDKKKLNIKKRKTKKKQIVLFDTHRRLDDYIMMLKYRNNGKYENIPHYCISKLGKIYKIMEPEYSSNTFNNPKIDQQQIKIAIENLGWLTKHTITGILFNWINDPYRGIPHAKNWRNYYWWDKYTDEQLNSLAELTMLLCVEYDIPYKGVSSSAYVEKAEKLHGIVSKSNFSDIYTDINPSFNFNIFEDHVKQIELSI
jgi:N-acetyl-anhydromuramyl-L-alanine amidase AmpD